MDAVEPKQICVKGEHVLSVTLRNAKIQKNLNFVLILVNENGEIILRAIDQVRFPNGLIKFLIGDISAYIIPNTKFNVLVKIEDYVGVGDIDVNTVRDENAIKITVRDHDSAAQSWCQCVTSSVKEFRNNYGGARDGKRFNVNQLTVIESCGSCQCAKMLCKCIAQDGISNYAKIQKKSSDKIRLKSFKKSPWQDFSDYFPLKFFMLPLVLCCIYTLCKHM